MLFQFFVRLEHIRKCFTMKEGVFVLEEYSKSKLKSFQKLISAIFSPQEPQNSPEKIQISHGKFIYSAKQTIQSYINVISKTSYFFCRQERLL